MKKTVSLVSAVLLLSMLLGICGVNAEAVGSLTIKYTRKDTGRGIGGVEMTVFKAGSPVGEGYALTESFLGSDVDLSALSTADKKYKAAEILFRYAVRNGISGVSAETDGNGNAFFGNLSPGVYLAAQTKELSGYKTISPYLVFIPGQGTDGKPIYHVLSNVKTEREGGGSGGDKTFSVSVAKIWDDSDDADGIRPSSVSITLLRAGTKHKTVSLSAENGWRHTFSGLTGSAALYTVEETPVDGYTASYSGSAASGFVIVNSHSAENPPKTDEISVSVRKQWDDESDKQGIRPKSITVQLIRDGVVFRTAQLDASNGWYFRFDKLPDAKYTVKEISPEGYSASYQRANGSLYTIINTIGSGADEPPPTPVHPSYTDISVKKVWDDKENADGSRPSSVTVDLIKDGEKYASAQLSEENGWQHRFSDLPKSSVYSVYEQTAGKYGVAYSGSAAEGYVITNTYPAENPVNEPPEPTSPTAVDIPVEKLWNDGDNEEGIRPQSVTVKLIRDGSVYRELELSEDGGWSGVFAGVPSDGSYTILEDAVSGYSVVYAQSGNSGFTITNTASIGTTDIGIPPQPFIPALNQESTPDSAVSEIAIPQTGSLNWPVPLLAVSGMLFIILGLIHIPGRRGEKK